MAWNQSTDINIAGYKLYYGATSRTYTQMVIAGNSTSITIPGLVEDTTYFFAVSAYNSIGLESDYSDEVRYRVPLTGDPLTLSNNSVTPTGNSPTVTLISPFNGESYTAPAIVNLAAGVTANGHSITMVQFYNGAALLGEAATAPYSFTWSNAGLGNYSLTARVVYDAGNTIDSSPVNISVTDLRAPWQTADIGSVGVAGSAGIASGLYSVKGAGNISGKADNFRFLYQPLSGDGEITVRLNSVENTGTSSRVGVMIRESLTSRSKYVFMGISSDGRFLRQHRIKTGGGTSSSASSTGTPPEVWTRLVRTGQTIYCYKSNDGTNWKLVSYRSLPMATNIYFGLAVASGASKTLNTSVFTKVTVVP